jgi:alpha-ribazole phosphatase
MADSSAPQTILWLMRHPEPEAAATGRCYGSLDWKLSEAGIRQAHAGANALANEPLAAIYTSPRQRCKQAAQILAAGRQCLPETMDALRELDFGEFEGRDYDEIAAAYPDLYRQWMEHPTEVRFPGGEGFSEMRVRVLAATRDLRLRHAGQSIAMVTHGGAIRIVLAEALGMQPAGIFRIGQRYGGISMIRYFGEVPVVELVNGEATSPSLTHSRANKNIPADQA